LGFHRVGIASAEAGPDTQFVHEWLARGYAGEMDYLGRRAEERADPGRVLAGARSAICVALVYDRETTGETHGLPPLGRIARYAGGEDYHELMKERLLALAEALEAKLGHAFGSRAYVDTGPILERTLAARAGLGWIGKNTLLIDPELGSYFFLGVLLTDLAVEPDVPSADHCGSCTACLDACPTGAFPEAHVMDASRCLSYTTIEKRGSIPESLRAAQSDWVFGCDICQDVCPWNRRKRRPLPPDPLGLRARLAPKPELMQPSLRWLLELDEETWREVTRKTAIRRTKWKGLVRNALVAAGNSGDRSLIDAVERHLASDEPSLAEHAAWALTQLEAARLPAKDANA